MAMLVGWWLVGPPFWVKLKSHVPQMMYWVKIYVPMFQFMMKNCKINDIVASVSCPW